MRSDWWMLWYLLNKIRWWWASNDRGNTPAFWFDWTNDYISSNATIGRTGYDMNVAWNVSTGSDGDGSYIQFNGNRTGWVWTKANVWPTSTPTYTQATSFSFKAKIKFSSLAAANTSGVFWADTDAAIYYDFTTNSLRWVLRWSTTVWVWALSTTTTGTAYDAYFVYDSAVAKFYCYLSTSGGSSVLQNTGGTAWPATFTTSNWYLWDDWVWAWTAESCNKYIYHAAIRNKALTQAEIDADIALWNTTKNDPSIVAYYIPDNLQYNTQYLTAPKTFWWAGRSVRSNATVTTNNATAPDGATTASTYVINAAGTQITNAVEQSITSISWATIASKTFIVKAFVRVVSWSNTFRLKCTHAGVADYYSSNQVATTTRQEFTFTQTFTSSTSWTGINAWLTSDTSNTAWSFQVRNVRLYLVNETLRDESPNIGWYIWWKTQKVLSCRYKPAADFADSATAWCLMAIPRAYLHDRASNHKPQIRYDDRVGARTSIATPLWVWFRGKVHVLWVIYRTGSAFATKFYTNGVLVDSDTRIALPPSSFIQSILESWRRSTTYFSWNIRDSRIYTFTWSFTDADALAIYNGGEPTSPGVTKYLHYKPLSWEIGTATSDLSGNLRDWTLNGWVTRVVV